MMKKLCLALFMSALGATAHAEQPVYAIQLRATASFSPDAKGGDTLNFYAPRLPSGSKLEFEALGYAMPVLVVSKDPALAIQEIADQIAIATGERLMKHGNSNSDVASKPNFIVAAHSDRAAVVLFLVPKGDDRYALICSYRFEKKPVQFPEPTSGPSPCRGSW